MLFLFSVCAAGHEGVFDPANPGTGCTHCTAGKFKAAAGDAVCFDCPPGTISAAGATACDVCPEDQYQDMAGQTSCYYCGLIGTTNSLTGQTTCSKKFT